MAQHEEKNCGCEEDGCADALVAIALIALYVGVMSFWLHGMV
ncbi:MAG: hypothetical protein R3E63_09155 [Pseudomonadales bacterium]